METENEKIEKNPKASLEKKIIRELSLVSVLGNVFLFVFKMFGGVAGHSSAMVSDAVHSLSDVLTTAIAYAGVRIAGKEADENHPYGHERFECIASICLGILLAATGVGIGYAGVQRIVTGEFRNLAIPTMLPLAAAVVSILAKEAMFHYTLYHAKRIRSTAFQADAWHHRSDALSSVGSFIGVAGAKLGYPVMDCIASVVISLFVLKVAYEVLKDAFVKMMDTSLDQELEMDMKKFILEQPGVERVDLLTTRQFGSKAYVDVEIAVKNSLSIVEAHKIAEEVHHHLEQRFPEIKHVMVHVNPEEM